MCDTCGCNVTPGNKHLIEIKGKLSRTADGKAAVDVLRGLLSENDHQALHNRQHFDKHQVLAINLMSSPGSGKTALLEATIETIGKDLNIAVIEGDLETENDAQRIRAKGVPAIQIATGSACHLDAHMVHNAVHQLDLKSLDILFIENVGNLVCPASFDLGHHRNVTLLSVTEGDDKPAKYPVMFRAADAMLITKADLLQVLDDFNCDNAHQHLRNLANPAPVIQLSAKTRQGFNDWISWLQLELDHYQQHLARGEKLHPRIQPDGHKLHEEGYAHHQHNRS
jgi:hydrogenase nickel incorporation protein HypB